MDTLLNDETERFLALGSGVVRPKGVHMTNLIRGIQAKMGTTKYAAEWNMNVAAECGFIWEDVFSRVFADRFVVRLDAQELDGVMCSPDGVGPDPGWKVKGEWEIEPDPTTLILDEYKFTWRGSVKQKPWDDFYWMSQLKGYCKVMDVDIAIMHILYVMGDYRGSGPQYVEARFHFSQFEIDQCWSMLLREKESRGKDGDD